MKVGLVYETYGARVRLVLDRFFGLIEGLGSCSSLLTVKVIIKGHVHNTTDSCVFFVRFFRTILEQISTGLNLSLHRVPWTFAAQGGLPMHCCLSAH